MRAESGPHARIYLLGPQHLLSKLEIAFVDVLFTRKRNLRRLVVCPFRYSDRGLQRQKSCQVLRCPMVLCLQAHTNVLMVSMDSAVGSKRRVYIIPASPSRASVAIFL